MQEHLVDVLNERDTVLHVVPVKTEDTAPNDAACVEEALKAAGDMQLVPESDAGKLKARIHVSRGGPLMPFADVVQVKQEQQGRREDRIRTRAYFLWQHAGCPDGQADAHWQDACKTEGG